MAGSVNQVVGHLPSKTEALSSKPSTTKKGRRKEGREEKGREVKRPSLVLSFDSVPLCKVGGGKSTCLLGLYHVPDAY
jgi:hypothetical protein